MAQPIDVEGLAFGPRLRPSETPYVAPTSGRQRLNFSRSGNAHIEQAYRTHWVSPGLPAQKQERLAQKASTPPELVVIAPLNDDWPCHRCSVSGDLLMMEPPGPACLRCVGLDDLEFLPAGDALPTRRAKARSGRHAVVVRFSRTRKRYERQGVLVEPQALIDAQREIDQERNAADGQHLFTKVSTIVPMAIFVRKSLLRHCRHRPRTPRHGRCIERQMSNSTKNRRACQ